MSGNIAITGIPTTPGANGAVPLRRELRDLQRNFPDQYNLLILGLKNLEGQTETGLTSYYQLAGIHGLPYKPWNGVGSTTNWQTSSGFGGYCTHSSILFLTWHRPYLALYEQSLYNAVQAVATQFPQGALRDKYVQAAKTFRAPYFDWASQPPQGTSAFPSAFTAPNVTVVDVDGKTKSTANPLYRFAFHPVNPSQGDFPAQWSRYQTTVRYPNRSGQSQDARIGPILSNELASLRSNVGLLLLSYTKYDAFSFNRWDTNTNPGEFGSIEDLHNEIHDRTGGGGHMSSLEVSAFDPLFWLHHINVDRLWAIWQELNPNSDMTPRPAPYSTFSATGGQSQTKDTPLAPFWDKSGTKFWTSAQIKSTLTFGYAYPETQKWLFADTPAYQANIRQAVTSLYGTNVFTNFVANVAQRKDEHAIAVSALAAQPNVDVVKTESFKADAAKADAVKADVVVVTHGVKAEDAPVEKAAAPAHDKPAFAVSQTVFAAREPAAKPVVPAKKEGPIPASLKHLAPNNTYTEWVVNVRAQKHGLGSSFRTLVFLGAFDESNPASWDTEFNCVGRVSVLGRDPTETQCSKCRTDAAGELMVSGTVPLTSALLQDIVEGEVASLDPAVVVPHLKEKLKWKVTLFSGEERDAAEVPGLKVSVASTKVTIGEDGLPQYSHEYTVWPEITDGKPAGLGAGEHV